MCELHQDMTRLPVATRRRDVLKFTLASAGLMALGPMGKFLPTALGAPRSLKRMVVINLRGGADTLSMCIPTGLSRYYERRPAIAIDPGDQLSLDNGPHRNSDFTLHPNLTKVQALWQEGSVAAIQRVGYPRANLSHFTSQDIFSLGVRDGFSSLGQSPSGWIARFAERYAPTALGAVSIGQGRPLDFVGGSSSPLLVQNLSSFELEKGGNRGDDDTPRHRHRAAAARTILERWSKPGNSQEVKTALSQATTLADQIQGAVDSYESNVTYVQRSVSRQLQDVARLIQAGFETRVFYTGYGGHDTHGGQVTRMETLMTYLDEAIGAFADDCKAMGVWDDMAVVVITEFGRRNFENGSEGTDHGHAYCGLVIGGRVHGGVYGDMTNNHLNENWAPYDIDFRTIYKETLADHLGVNAGPVFPEDLERDVNLNLF